MLCFLLCYFLIFFLIFMFIRLFVYLFNKSCLFVKLLCWLGMCVSVPIFYFVLFYYLYSFKLMSYKCCIFLCVITLLKYLLLGSWSSFTDFLFKIFALVKGNNFFSLFCIVVFAIIVLAICQKQLFLAI